MSVSSASEFANLTAQDATLEIACGGYGTFGIQLSGTWTGTITFEGTVDHGTWQSVNVTKTNSTTQVTSATGNGVWTGPCAGLLAVRARFSTFGSGTAYARLLIAGTGGGSGSGGGGGGGGGTSSDFGAAFPASGTAAGFQGSTGNMEPVILEADGSLPVTIIAGGGSGGTSSAFGAAFPADGTAIGVSDPSGNMEALSAETLDYDTGAGTVAQTIIGLALPGAGGPVAGFTATNPGRVDPTGTTTQPVSAASLPLPTGAATEATLASLNAKVTVVDTSDVTVTASALPTGAATLAEQQTQSASLSVLDDWDESDRAKVNPIVGQAGVQGGSGTVSALTQRVVLATDVALPAGTNAIGKLSANSGVDIGDVDVTSLPVCQQIMGSAQTVISTAVDIAAGNFSGAPAATFTNNDAAVPGALYAMAMGEFPDWAAAPVAGTVVELWGLLKDVDGTDDDTDAPSGTSSGGAMFFGSWPIAAADALQRRTIPIALPGITSGGIGIDFYIKNGTAQNMNNDAGTSCVVKITPFTTKG